MGPNCPFEDAECEVLGGDSGCERGCEQLVDRLTSAEESAKGVGGKRVGDGEDELTGELGERHGGVVMWVCGGLDEVRGITVPGKRFEFESDSQRSLGHATDQATRTLESV